MNIVDMNEENMNEEKMLRGKGYACVAGIDEAGRGPLAGPVVACALTACVKLKRNKNFKLLRDSKKLSASERKRFYNLLTDCSSIEWGIGRVSEKVIDKINIFQATKLAMVRAVRNLEKKLGRKADFLLLDGNFNIPMQNISQKAIVKADEKVFSCTAASVIAKVSRDRLMVKYHKKYPQYGFDRHKGYGTKQHFAALQEYGPCEIHRKSFAPIKNF